MTKTPSDFLHLQSSTGVAGRCTRAASGHAAPPRSVMKSWRRMGPSTPEDLYLPPRISDRKKHVSGQESHSATGHTAGGRLGVKIRNPQNEQFGTARSVSSFSWVGTCTNHQNDLFMKSKLRKCARAGDRAGFFIGIRLGRSVCRPRLDRASRQDASRTFAVAHLPCVQAVRERTACFFSALNKQKKRVGCTLTK